MVIEMIKTIFKNHLRNIFCICVSLLLISQTGFSQLNTAKPWAYWWWMGSAVTKEGIKQNLATYAKAGFGGLHIIPIYGVKGEEANFIPYLSPQWFEMLDYTLIEAHKNGLGIDMSLGSGWPFGGAQVMPKDAAKEFKINELNGKYELIIANTNQKVKRSAPGAEGLVVDHFDKNAVTHYLEPFEKAFSKKNYPIRAFYNDSYEVYGANWTPDFFEKFKKYRGYNLAEHLDVLSKNTASTDSEKRIWSDYHETISDLLYHEFDPTWMNFAKKYGKITRDEAHGSPANILDLYAQSDIPESEFFGSKPYNIPMYRQDPAYEESRFGTPGSLILKLASSAANVAGKKLVSSETATWLGNHFQVSLAQIKPIIDESFVGGVNHVFYHGLPYSPPNEPFPGWLFYASTNFNQNSHFWNELPLLNKYIENCQQKLQNSKPDNDILLYFPIYDLWANVGPNTKTHTINVHTILNDGMFKGDLGNLANTLTNNGFTFDFISDRQILKSKTDEQGNIVTESGQKYKTIIIPKSTYFSLETLKEIDGFRKKGAKIIFEDHTPTLVNGFSDFEKRQAEFSQTIKSFQSLAAKNIIQTLDNKGIRKEPISLSGLTYIRKKTKTGSLYFITNQSNQAQKADILLSVNAKAAKTIDPLNSNTENDYSFNTNNRNFIQIPLRLISGQSIFIETYDKPLIKKTVQKKAVSPSKKMEINSEWKVEFMSGNPFIPASYTTKTLKSWTAGGDTSRAYFSGKAKYSTTFSIPNFTNSASAVLNLGDVRETAKVTINGQIIGTAWCLPFHLAIPKGILKAENKIEIEVTNLSANRIRYMDLKGIKWKKFYDINMVDIGYRPLDAAKWQPVESGLLGEISIEY